MKQRIVRSAVMKSDHECKKRDGGKGEDWEG